MGREPPRWQAELCAALGAGGGAVPTITAAEPVAGGDINEAYKVSFTSRPPIFVKSHRTPPVGMYAAEAHGLGWLRAGPLRVPEVLAVGSTFLALEWLDLGRRGDDLDAALGRGLAALHATRPSSFGLDRTNYLATIAQDNTAEDDVATFWVERRLRPLIARMQAPELHRRLDALGREAERFGPPEPPARLHGDLWWGNVVVCDGAPVLIDPAVYGGHREIDLAMLALFGGVSDRLIAAYEEVWPLERGWRQRVPLWQLYPLAAHAVLFGGGYGGQVAQILRDLT